jgi:hypothetical protein
VNIAVADVFDKRRLIEEIENKRIVRFFYFAQNEPFGFQYLHRIKY